jgi:magnesium-transporting ATPase (P-type)
MTMETTSENRNIEIGTETLNNLNATWKWTMFLSVLGFIFLGLLIVVGLITSTFLTAFKSQEVNLGIPESLLIIVFSVIAAIYFFPVWFLFRFSRHTRNAVQTLDKLELHKAFKNLRIYFTYIGIMVIIVLSIYIVALIAAGASMSFLKGM